MIRRNAARVFFRITGWRVVGDGPDPRDTNIFVAAPHTSGFDSALMLATVWSHDLRVRFLIKNEIMQGPFRWFWRAVGGIGVQRDNPGPLIDELVRMAADKDGFQLVITPEGTRKPVKYWKSGFYRFSMASGIPLALAAPDVPAKTVTWGPRFHPSGDVVADMDLIRSFFNQHSGVVPEKATEPRMRAEDDPESLRQLFAAIATDREALRRG